MFTSRPFFDLLQMAATAPPATAQPDVRKRRPATPQPAAEPPLKRARIDGTAAGAASGAGEAAAAYFRVASATTSGPAVGAAGPTGGVASAPTGGEDWDEALLIPQSAPERPQKPSVWEINTGTGMTLRDYMTRLVPSVQWRLSKFLAKLPGVMLSTPLQSLVCPDITGETGETTKSFRERWSDDRCVLSLRATGLYEAAAPIWWFDLLKEEFMDFKSDEPTWAQFEAASLQWSEAQLRASSQEEHMQRFIVPGLIPTAIRSVDIASAIIAAEARFHSLPACGGLVMLWSIIGAFDKFLAEQPPEQPSKTHLALKMFEASLSVTVRMRAAASSTQLVLDNLQYSESLRVMNFAAAADSFWQFATRVAQLEIVDAKQSIAAMLPQLVNAGITWQGKDLNKHHCHALQTLAPLTKSDLCQDAAKLLEHRLPSLMTSPTYLGRLVAAVKKEISNENDSASMFADFLKAVWVNVFTGEVAADDMTCDFLLGKGRKPGFLHVHLTANRFVKWFFNQQLQLAASGADSLTASQVAKLNQHVGSLWTMWRGLAGGHDTAASQDEGADLPGLKSFFENDKVEALLASEKEKPAFALAARLLLDVYTGEHATDLLALAESQATFEHFLQPHNAAHSQTFRDAYQGFLQELMKGPEKTDHRLEHQLDTEPHFTDDDGKFKQALLERTMKAKRELVKLHVVSDWREPTKAFCAKGGTVSQAWLRSKAHLRNADAPGKTEKKHVAIIFSPELLPTREQFESAQVVKGSVVKTEAVQRALEWMSSARGDNTVLLAFDGRDKKVKRACEDWLDEKCPDPMRHIQGPIMYQPTKTKQDPRFPGKSFSFASVYEERFFGQLPSHKKNFKMVPRDHFNACSEATTHYSSYTAVPVRPFQHLPKLSVEDKERMTGLTQPALTDTVIACLDGRGVPLFWQEIKDVDFFVAIFKDLHIGSIFDLTPGTGAAAAAALLLRIMYDAVCMNELHRNFLDNILEKAVWAVLSATDDDEEYVAALREHFPVLVDQGRRYLGSAEQSEDDDEPDEPDEPTE